MINELLRHVLNIIFQISSSNAKVGHRNRLNVFDVTKLIRYLNISHHELREYLKWLQMKPEFMKEIFPFEFIDSSNNHELDLSFGIDVNEIKKSGFDFLPPNPSSFTYKFTSIYGKREEEALTILKRRTNEKLKIENNLYNSMKSKELLNFINFDEI